jgi:hypothetical protein
MLPSAMAKRLGIDRTELEVLEAQERAHSLPGSYRNLEDYLGVQVLQAQQREWETIMLALDFARMKAEASFEGTDEFHAKLRVFVATLEVVGDLSEHKPVGNYPSGC